MFTFDTTDQKEVRRLRIAQFNCRIATVTSDGLTMTGHVRSVLERKSSGLASWSITLVPAVPKIAAVSAGVPRPGPRVAAFAEDRY